MDNALFPFTFTRMPCQFEHNRSQAIWIQRHRWNSNAQLWKYTAQCIVRFPISNITLDMYSSRYSSCAREVERNDYCFNNYVFSEFMTIRIFGFSEFLWVLWSFCLPHNVAQMKALDHSPVEISTQLIQFLLQNRASIRFSLKM